MGDGAGGGGRASSRLAPRTNTSSAAAPQPWAAAVAPLLVCVTAVRMGVRGVHSDSYQGGREREHTRERDNLSTVPRRSCTALC